jgi:hypothetical protein
MTYHPVPLKCPAANKEIVQLHEHSILFHQYFVYSHETSIVKLFTTETEMPFILD